jgi:hypothetical protein
MGFFWDRVSQTICLGWLRTVSLLSTASWVARITGVSHQRAACSALPSSHPGRGIPNPMAQTRKLREATRDCLPQSHRKPWTELQLPSESPTLEPWWVDPTWAAPAYSIYHFFFFFLVVLGIELRVSHLLGRCSSTWARHPVLLFLVCFSGRVSN